MPPAKPQHPVLILSEKGDVLSKKIAGAAGGEMTFAAVQAYYKKKQVPECIGTFPYKTLTLFLFGVQEGDDDHENKHQLPPPYDSITFYGDILLIASKDESSFAHPVLFKPEEYEAFYTKAFGGFDSDEEGGEEGEEELVVEEAEGKEFAAAGITEEDAEEEEEEADAEEEDAEEEEDVDAEVVDDGDEAVPAVAAAVKRKPKKRKAAAKSSSSAAGNTSAYPDRPILSEAEQLQFELTPTNEEPAHKNRLHTLQVIRKTYAQRLTNEQMINLERSIYNGALHEANTRHIVRSWDYPLFTHLHTMTARRIISNLDPKSYVQNNDLFEMLKAGSIGMDSLSEMSTYDLYPSRWKDMIELQNIREKRQLEGNKSMATDQFLCTRCWKRECTYYEMQTRSADEPMTIFITCLNCGKHWRQ